MGAHLVSAVQKILRQELTSSFHADISDLRHDMGQELGHLRQETGRLGSMLMLGLGLLFAAFKLT